ncbi:MAG: carbonic anhydrase [Betaproteobacteria bacterium]|nr:MAG: carbonic anhydrase [Betaproteobacteria bacterium]
MPDEIVKRLRRFQTRYFPRLRSQFRDLVEQGQRPTVLFIGCSDSRVLPYLILDSGPGELFIVRNVGNFVPPYDASHGYHGTAAAVEFAVLNLDVSEIIVCGHNHCGAVRALYTDLPAEANHMAKWLDLGRDAVLPVTLSEEALRRTEQRSVALQLERLMDYPMVRRRVEEGRLYLRGWHYLIEEGRVLVLDVESGLFEPFDAALQAARANDPLAGVNLLP